MPTVPAATEPVLPSAPVQPTPSGAPLHLPLTAVSGATLLLDPAGLPYLLVQGRPAEGQTGADAPVYAVALDAAGRARSGWPVVLAESGWLGEAVVDAAGTLYAVVGHGQGPSSLVAVLPDGRPAPGWPVQLPTGCGGPPLVASDGTLRITCYDGATRARVLALDRRGDGLPGWPVEVGGEIAEEALARGTDTILLVTGEGWVRHVRLRSDGTIESGQAVDVPVGAVYATNYALGPDGTGYAWWPDYQVPETAEAETMLRLHLQAFDTDGLLPGWPLTIKGEVSPPAFGSDGRVYLTVGSQRHGPTTIHAYDRNARGIPGWPVTLPVTAAIGWPGAGPWPPAPVQIGADGTVYLVTEDSGTTIYALDPDGRQLPGWPYRSDAALADSCGRGGGGCGHPVIRPIVDGPGRLHIVHAAVNNSSRGDSAVLVGPTGRVADGWPVTLRRAYARFTALQVAPDSMTYVLANEIDSHAADGRLLQSETLLAIDPGGEVLYRTTVVENLPADV